MAQDGPSETKLQSYPLFREVRRQRTLDSAWRHIRERASGSTDPATRQDWSEIEQNTRLYITRLQREISSGKFRYARQKGVLKQRAGKFPRPIVVAPLKSRIVQRALLSVCQSDQRSLVAHLGDIPERLSVETSVGGLPGRGARDAIRLIRKAISDGARYYVKSDIENFFTNLPRANIDGILKGAISDTAFLKLLLDGLETDLANSDAEQIRRHWDIFPNEEIGVPQGSSLSALCANLLMADFDRQMNDRGIVTIRYLDDFLILAPTATAATRAWQSASKQLNLLGMTAHDPLLASQKANRGKISDGFEFLSFLVTDTQVAPTREARSKVILDVDKTLREAVGKLRDASANSRRAEEGFVQTLAKIDRKVRGWGDAFQDTTQRLIFNQMDERLALSINRETANFLRALKGASPDEQRRMWGVALLRDTKTPEASEAKIRSPFQSVRKAAP